MSFFMENRMQELNLKANEIIAEIEKVIIGKTEQIREILTAFLAGGHILLEDIPGVGKTTLAGAYSRAMGLSFKRMQFTPDVMPSDLTGFSIYSRSEEKFVYQSGAVFCNIFLADEINRTSPKTQSALLEVMEEHQVTVEGVTRPVPSPFLVIATQNPYGAAGTQPLPEAQIDRFMVSMTLGYPDFESEVALAKAEDSSPKLDRIHSVIDGQTLLQMQNEVMQVYISDGIYRYIVRLVEATRSDPSIELGASPRATIALVRLSRAHAWLNQRNYVIPADIASQFLYALRHRIILTPSAAFHHTTAESLLQKILSETKAPSPGESY